jgi:prepilin-type N-terminal cleavage/methylation domain-containing protein
VLKRHADTVITPLALDVPHRPAQMIESHRLVVTHMPNRNRSGFTFVELLTAMLLLGLLSAIAVPRFRSFKERAYFAAMKSDLGNIRIAEEEYFSEHQQYVTDTASLGFRATTNVKVTITSADLSGGYTAVTTHNLLAGQQCSTKVGKEAVNVPNGDIMCTSLGASGSGAQVPPVP